MGGWRWVLEEVREVRGERESRSRRLRLFVKDLSTPIQRVKRKSV